MIWMPVDIVNESNVENKNKDAEKKRLAMYESALYQCGSWERVDIYTV